MRYSGLIPNDISAAPGICVSFFVQGCPFRCKGCHNPDSWDFNGGEEFTSDTLNKIVQSLRAQNIKRDLCIMGGEPMCEENLFLTYMVIKEVKDKLPDTKIYLWSGYTYEELLSSSLPKVEKILELTDILIDGRYIEEERDVTLQMRGSSNQRIIDLYKKN